MTKAQYVKEQEKVMRAASLILQVDLDGFLTMIATAETMGPILDPTMYREAIGNLSALKRVAEHFKKAQPDIEELKKQVLNTLGEQMEKGKTT